MALAYDDAFVTRLADDIEELIESRGGVSAEAVMARSLELAQRNCAAFSRYSKRFGLGLGVPDRAFKAAAPYFFPGVEPALTFETSGTSGASKGRAHYTPLGERLLRATILAGARREIVFDLQRPAIVRLVPTREHAPAMVMAYGMQLIAEAYGDPAASASVIDAGGLDFEVFDELLGRAVAADQPVVMLGGSFAFVNLCERLRALHKRWRLPSGSRVVDAGGFKGRSRCMSVEALRALVADTFGVPKTRFTNIFGMTELASQLYDAADAPLGPSAERRKRALAHAWPRLRNPRDLRLLASGTGLLEVVDLCVIDRPCVVLTGDLGVGDEAGIALAGRVQGSDSRGCSLTLDALTAPDTGADHACT
jgi:hypothetical protein